MGVQYSETVTAEICERIAQGESLRAICRDKHMPDLSNVIRWLADDRRETFRAQYTRAREAQADHFVDEIVEIADSASPEDVNAARLRVDARKWVAGKMRPKVYGDKAEVEHTGGVTVTLRDMLAE